MSKMLPFLMFQGGHAETAMNLYVSLFEDGEILDITRWQRGEAARRAASSSRAFGPQRAASSSRAFGPQGRV